MKTHILKLTCGLALLGTVITASAQSVISSWTTWTSPGSFPYNATFTGNNSYSYNTTATGSLTMPDSTSVAVTLHGEVSDTLSSFGGSSPNSDIWSSFPNGTFTSANVPTLPDTGDDIFAGGFGVGTQTITFSRPVSDIVFNIFSLGGGGTTASWQFDQPFVVLSQDPRVGCNLSVDGTTLSGDEASGTIQFTGTFTSFSWDVTAPEWGFGWNVGATSASVEPTPEPSTLALSVMGGLLLYRRRK
jgi:hypothetical protein